MLNPFPRRRRRCQLFHTSSSPPAKEARYCCGRKQLLLILLYLGLNESQKRWSLLNKSVANRADGCAIAWNIELGRV